MSLKIGRQGWLGLGIESTPGTTVSATTTLPFIANTLGGKHKSIDDIAARASRAQNYTSVIGQRWSEGEIDVNVDSQNIGFLLKLGLGNEIVNTVVTSQVFDHLFYTTTSGNTPATATLYLNKGVDTQLYPSMAIDKLELNVKDGLMTAKTSFKGLFPTTGSYAPVTVSGTLFPFNKYTAQFGANLVSAASASATALTEFQLIVTNDVDVIFESGNANASRVAWKALKITGSFINFFEDVTTRDNFYNLNKQSMILTASGMALPGSNVESLKITLAKIAYEDVSIDAGLENFFSVKTTFTAEVDVLQGKQMDIILRNYRSTVYS